MAWKGFENEIENGHRDTKNILLVIIVDPNGRMDQEQTKQSVPMIVEGLLNPPDFAMDMVPQLPARNQNFTITTLLNGQPVSWPFCSAACLTNPSLHIWTRGQDPGKFEIHDYCHFDGPTFVTFYVHSCGTYDGYPCRPVWCYFPKTDTNDCRLDTDGDASFVGQEQLYFIRMDTEYYTPRYVFDNQTNTRTEVQSGGIPERRLYWFRFTPVYAGVLKFQVVSIRDSDKYTAYDVTHPDIIVQGPHTSSLHTSTPESKKILLGLGLGLATVAGLVVYFKHKSKKRNRTVIHRPVVHRHNHVHHKEQRRPPHKPFFHLCP